MLTDNAPKNCATRQRVARRFRHGRSACCGVSPQAPGARPCRPTPRPSPRTLHSLPARDPAHSTRNRVRICTHMYVRLSCTRMYVRLSCTRMYVRLSCMRVHTIFCFTSGFLEREGGGEREMAFKDGQGTHPIRAEHVYRLRIVEVRG
jgi:hypothetical protein